ncbi:hypothetical protein TSUD_166170 [Trifolium subterraneum]|uniref:Uncharacterized protein n=1 Tax=Trifolium subterraneum TaxID=3900 RepID=A0A2Z6N961_TRISU|nr:hypothetical protein TSUD_166170 [Trifolium subterraneum]
MALCSQCQIVAVRPLCRSLGQKKISDYTEAPTRPELHGSKGCIEEMSDCCLRGEVVKAKR